jgi:hypothetical protein
MIDSRRFASAVAGLGMAAAVAGGLAAQAAPGRIGSTPHISLRPNHVMVNGTTMLSGTGFPPSSMVRVEECGRTAWIVPEEPCDSTNAVTVMSNSAGRFATAFEAQLCPRELPPKPPVTREKCYIGEPRPTGEDTVGLVGAAKIIVTYP